MEFLLIVFFGIIALILLVIGLLYRDTYFILPAGIIFLLLGTVTFFNGIDYKTGEIKFLDVTTNSTIVQDTYSTFKGGFNADFGLSYVLFFVGIYCLYLPIEWASKRKKQLKSERTYSEEE